MRSLLKRNHAIRVAFASVGVSVVFVLIALAVITIWTIRSPLPKIDGHLAVDGISAPIVIDRDTRGIPHVRASTEKDLFFAEGFTCAQDRLWQMDGERRQAEGKLSEIAGPATLESDRYMRTLGLHAAAEHDAQELEEPAKSDLEAYAAGVNAEMQSHPLPLEFRLLGYRPEPWTPADSLAVVKLMAQRLDDQWNKIQILSQLKTSFGLRAALALTDNQVPELEKYIDGYGNRRATQPLRHATTSVYPSIGWAKFKPPLQREPGTGSNNWAVAGTRVSTGKPVLANDTHLAHSLPSTWWLVHLQGAGFNVEGFTIPGLPGVVIGHNDHIAFGVTSADEAVQDLFVERFRSAQSDEYFANGRWVGAAHRIERIVVKNQPESVLDILVTRHGPILERRGTKALSLAWTTLRAGGEAQGLRDVDLATNFAQFRVALAHITAPALSFAYADVTGNIGYQDSGRVPKRRLGDGSLPVEGADDRFGWDGYIPFDQLPHALNPRGGIVATANNQLTADGSRMPLSPFYDSPFRVHRIFELLSQTNPSTPQAIGAVQSDVYDYPRAQLAKITAARLQSSSDQMLRRIGAQLAGWKGMADASTVVSTFLDADDAALTDEVLGPKLSADLLARYRKEYRPLIALERVMAGDTSLASMGIKRQSIIRAIPSAARIAAQRTRANTVDGLERIQRWGRHNAALYEHPLGRFWPLNAVLSVRPLDQPGNVFTVYAGRPTYGPSQRLVVDLANWDNSSMLLTLGESGEFSDPHYADQAEDFVNVRWGPTPFSAAAVKRATRSTLTLLPRGESSSNSVP